MILSKLIDGKGRNLNYLRLSVTDRCNLRCIYCSPLECSPKLKHDDILRYEEILRLVKIAASVGIEKIRITGGEPLVRKGLCEFIKKISYISEIKDISLTTNGILLLKNLEKLKKVGISRINISLDTLSTKKYEYITQYNEFQKVWDGIMYAHELGFNPIKINIVVIKGLNDDEVCDFAKLSFNYPFHIRFIEYMPIGINKIKSKYQVLTPEIKRKLCNIGHLNPVRSEVNAGPAERFKFNKALGEVGFISALSHNFCHKCNRLRLTANGDLRSCLLSNHSVPLKDLIRNKCSDDEIISAFANSICHKNAKHNLVFSNNNTNVIVEEMCNIGG